MAFFQTSGDVTVRHLMKSVGCMVKNGCTMWLMAASVDVELLRVIRHWQERGWVAQVRLMTREDCEAAVAGEMIIPAGKPQGTVEGEAAGAAVIQQQTGQGAASEAAVMYGRDEWLTGGLLAFDDGKEAVVIQGEMLLGTVPGMKGYAGCFGAVGSDAVKGAMDAVKALMKARAKAVTKPCGEAQGTAAEKRGMEAGAAMASPETKEETGAETGVETGAETGAETGTAVAADVKQEEKKPKRVRKAKKEST